jgi:hypothetical protein
MWQRLGSKENAEEAGTQRRARLGSGGNGVAELRFDLDSGEAGGIPTTAEGFDEEHSGDKALALDDGRLLLVIEEVLLGADDVKITDKSTGVA